MRASWASAVNRYKMTETELISTLASITLQATPLIIAVCGETLTERVGVVNLSLDGSMLMSAMTGFVVGLKTESLWIGLLAGAGGGGVFALILLFCLSTDRGYLVMAVPNAAWVAPAGGWGTA